MLIRESASSGERTRIYHKLFDQVYKILLLLLILREKVAHAAMAPTTSRKHNSRNVTRASVSVSNANTNSRHNDNITVGRQSSSDLLVVANPSDSIIHNNQRASRDMIDNNNQELQTISDTINERTNNIEKIITNKKLEEDWDTDVIEFAIEEMRARKRTLVLALQEPSGGGSSSSNNNNFAQQQGSTSITDDAVKTMMDAIRDYWSAEPEGNGIVMYRDKLYAHIEFTDSLKKQLFKLKLINRAGNWNSTMEAVRDLVTGLTGESPRHTRRPIRIELTAINKSDSIDTIKDAFIRVARDYNNYIFTTSNNDNDDNNNNNDDDQDSNATQEDNGFIDVEQLFGTGSVNALALFEKQNSTANIKITAQDDKAEFIEFKEGKPYGPKQEIRDIRFKANANGIRALFGIGSPPSHNGRVVLLSGRAIYPKMIIKPWSCRTCYYIGPEHKCTGRVICVKCGRTNHMIKDCRSKLRRCANCKQNGHGVKEKTCPVYRKALGREIKRVDMPIEYLANSDMRKLLKKRIIF